MRLTEDTKLDITPKEFEDAFPELYFYYKKFFGSSKPQITIYATEDRKNKFTVEVGDSLSDYFVDKAYAYLHKGKVDFVTSKELELSGKEGRNLVFDVDFSNGDAFMKLNTGYKSSYAEIYIPVSSLNQSLIPEDSNLSIPEIVALYGLKNIILAARYERFVSPYNIKIDGEVISNSDYKKACIETFEKGITWKDAYRITLESLAEKGLAKINKAGSTQITTEGKNVLNSLDL